MAQPVDCSAITDLKQCLAQNACYGYIQGGQTTCQCSNYAYGPNNACIRCGLSEIRNTARTACVCFEGTGLNVATNACEKCVGNTYMELPISQSLNTKEPCLICNAVGRIGRSIATSNLSGHNQCRCDASRGFVDDFKSQNVDCVCQSDLVLSQDSTRCIQPNDNQQPDSGSNNDNTNGGNNGNTDNSNGTGAGNGNNSNQGNNNQQNDQNKEPGDSQASAGIAILVMVTALLVLAIAVALGRSVTKKMRHREELSGTTCGAAILVEL